MKWLILLLVSILSMLPANGKDADECEVCISFLKKVQTTVEESYSNSPEDIEKAIRHLCKNEYPEGTKEKRLCYYIGGDETSASTLLNHITKPLSYHKPVEKICKNLKEKDDHICALKYEKELDWANINLKKMRVKELKKILSKWNADCKGCLEKSDYIKRIEELKPKYVRQEL